MTTTKKVAPSEKATPGLIRWSGLISFTVITGGLAMGSYFFADDLIEWSIEKAGSELLGARVEIEDVKISWSPMQLNIYGLDAADPDTPMQNLISFDQATAEIDALKLLMGQVIIPELSIIGLTPNTQRADSGALSNPEQTSEQDSNSNLPEFDVKLPSSDEILSRQNLITQQRADELQTYWEEQQVKLEQLQAQLPSQETSEQWKQQWEELSSGDISNLSDLSQRKDKFDSLRAEIKQAKQTVQALKLEIQNTKNGLKHKIEALRQAPEQDIAQLKSQYSLDAGGAANASQLLFGGQTGEWTNTALEWYEKLAPMLEGSDDTEEDTASRAKGSFIHFGKNTLPDFLINHAQIQTNLPFGSIDVSINDITHQPDVLGKPITIQAIGTELEQLEQLTANGILDFRNNQQAHNMTASATKWQLQNITLSDNPEQAIKLNDAIVDTELELTLKNSALKLHSISQFSDTQFSANSSINQILEQLNRFNLTVNAVGAIDSPQISIRSDLDNQLKNALRGATDKKVEAWENDLREKLNQKLSGSLNLQQGSNLDLLNNQANQQDSILDNLLSKKTGSSSPDAPIEDQLKQQLRGLF